MVWKLTNGKSCHLMLQVETFRDNGVDRQVENRAIYKERHGITRSPYRRVKNASTNPHRERLAIRF